MTPLLEVEHATFGYGPPKNFIAIVSDISFTISLGEFVLLVGPNGCGKSSIIRGLFNLVACSQGAIMWNIRKSEIGYIPQEPTIDHDIPATALDVVCTAQPYAWGSNRKAGMDALDTVGMSRFSAYRFGALSGGQKRRVLVARALFGNPKLLVLDEPTVNTDRETEKNIEKVLSDLCAANKVGIVASTHSETWAHCAKRYHIEEGTLHA
jgi:ABC-type Mn2+/Zn2+ transport system ATPase subunit